MSLPRMAFLILGLALPALLWAAPPDLSSPAAELSAGAGATEPALASRGEVSAAGNQRPSESVTTAGHTLSAPSESHAVNEAHRPLFRSRAAREAAQRVEKTAAGTDSSAGYERDGAWAAKNGMTTPPTAVPNRGSWGATVRQSLMLAGVTALIALLGWGYRATLNGSAGLGFRGRHAGVIQVLSRVAIAPRQSVCLMRIGPRLVLVGISPNALRTLDVIADADLVARLAGEQLSAKSAARVGEPFTQTLAEESKSYQAGPAAGLRTDTPPGAADKAASILATLLSGEARRRA